MTTKCAFNMVLNDTDLKSFNDLVSRDVPQKMLVVFYARWCRHCMDLMCSPESLWQSFVRKHKNCNDLAIKLGRSP
jgi:thioredoxin-like negative regulator of GroEL